MKRLHHVIWLLLFLSVLVFAAGKPIVDINVKKYITPSAYKVQLNNCYPISALPNILSAVWGAGVEYEVQEVNASGDGVLEGAPEYNVRFCKPADRCNGHIHRESLSEATEEDEDFIIHYHLTLIEDYNFYWQDDDNTTEDQTVDINRNGIQDDCENNVATPQGGDYLIGVVTDETNKLYHVVKDETSKTVTTQDGEQIELPYGTVSFDINVSNAGDSATVHIYYPYNPNIVGYAKEINGNWVKIDSTVQHDQAHNQTIVSFTLTDGGALDGDGIANKVIKDPGGGYIGQGQPQASVTVPLSPLALGFLIALFGFAGSRGIQRR
ncbi:hypothetical protein NitYY0826_C2044 [Nitratiruptor sp. YY08-26]|uniref:choice-of-anchor U domain-containing protein n=1 Tax=unclassified Nitratiruptor TaxID=2624044 RepID=UPI0019156DB7|nr:MULTISPECIES: choice-of-anchor U domain-containing protein [unclassified Nitratiruptor]BCD63150.1 hypothetical protein NitYY0813_C2042 [Nitratiruptor sp. YY08-13]BCD67085.1 hypothetical protein NitYY0826_C2044 [Nitratiruptor sp. YY08-26]